MFRFLLKPALRLPTLKNHKYFFFSVLLFESFTEIWRSKYSNWPSTSFFTKKTLEYTPINFKRPEFFKSP